MIVENTDPSIMPLFATEGEGDAIKIWAVMIGSEDAKILRELVDESRANKDSTGTSDTYVRMGGVPKRP